MRPTLRQLRYLVALAETGRFGDAARMCNVSQPALSAQIATLEADLGAVLVERRSSGIALTPAGRETVRRARQLLRDAQDLKDAVRSSDKQLTGTLRLGVLPSIGAYLLPIATTELHRRYPALRLHVQEDDTRSLTRGLVEGRLDCTLSTPGDRDDIRDEFLFDETLWVCAAPEDDINSEHGPIPLSALTGC